MLGMRWTGFFIGGSIAAIAACNPGGGTRAPLGVVTQ
jgi:hypothetical protein